MRHLLAVSLIFGIFLTSCNYELGPANLGSETALTPLPTSDLRNGTQLYASAGAGSGITYDEADDNAAYRLGVNVYQHIRFPRLFGSLRSRVSRPLRTTHYVGAGVEVFNGSYRIDQRHLPREAGTHWYRGFNFRITRGNMFETGERSDLHVLSHLGVFREYGDFSEAIHRSQFGTNTIPPNDFVADRVVAGTYFGGGFGFAYRPNRVSRIALSMETCFHLSEFPSAQSFGIRLDLSTERLGFNVKYLFFPDVFAENAISSPVVVSGGVHYELLGK